MNILGIDFGGTFIKYKVFEVNGENLGFKSAMFHIPTPSPSTPELVLESIKNVTFDLAGIDLVGMAIPCVVKQNLAKTATNIDKTWLDADLNELSARYFGKSCFFINDADAAAIPMLEHCKEGMSILLTFGTGIGAAMICDGQLIPNMEFGRMEFNGSSAENYVSARIKEQQNLSWEEYIDRINKFLTYVHDMFQPDQFIIGGGITDKWSEWEHMLKVPCPVMKAAHDNQTGVYGAAMYAYGQSK